jgi:hypothetical protein
MYATLWAISMASDSSAITSTSPATVNRRIKSRGLDDLKVVTGHSVQAMRTAYPYVEEILSRPGTVITDKEPQFPDHFTVS